MRERGTLSPDSAETHAGSAALSSNTPAENDDITAWSLPGRFIWSDDGAAIPSNSSQPYDDPLLTAPGRNGDAASLIPGDDPAQGKFLFGGDDGFDFSTRPYDPAVSTNFPAVSTYFTAPFHFDGAGRGRPQAATDGSGDLVETIASQ